MFGRREILILLFDMK